MTAARSPGRGTVSISWAGPGARVAVVDAVDVGEQHQRVGAGDVRDQRGEPVVVAEPDLLGGDRVVLVDDRQHAEGQQPLDGLLGVAVVAAAGEVVGGQQHLADGDAVPGERVGVGLHQPQLPDAGRGLRGRQVARPAGRAPAAPARRRSRRRRPARPPGRRRAPRRGRRPARDSRSASSPPGSVVSEEEPTLTTTRRAPAISGRAAVTRPASVRAGRRRSSRGSAELVRHPAGLLRRQPLLGAHPVRCVDAGCRCRGRRGRRTPRR